MSREKPTEPSNIVGFNEYMNDLKMRVGSDYVREGWYIARLKNPQAEDIDRYAADILMRVLKVTTLKDGAKKVYAVPVNSDGLEDVDEDDAVAMNRDGYFIEADEERGYLLDAFNRNPKSLGVLAASAAL